MTLIEHDRIDAALGRGRWVKDDEMDPRTNLWGRLYRTADGDVLRYSGAAPIVVDARYFTPEECGR